MTLYNAVNNSNESMPEQGLPIIAEKVPMPRATAFYG